MQLHIWLDPKIHIADYRGSVGIHKLTKSLTKPVDFSGELCFDISKPDRTPCKLIDVSKLHALEWHNAVNLEEGIQRSVESIRDHFQ